MDVHALGEDAVASVATSSEPLAIFGARVRERRQAKGWSQERLAAEADMHWTAISQLERGVRTPSLRTVAKVAAGLKCDPADLVAGLEPW